MVGYFANMAFPRLGEVTRCGILTRYEKIPFNKSFGTVITERTIDMIMFILLFILMVAIRAMCDIVFLYTVFVDTSGDQHDNYSFSHFFPLLWSGVFASQRIFWRRSTA